MCPVHKGTYRGRRVLLKLKSGERIVGRFEDGRGHYIVVEIDGALRRIPRGEIVMQTIYHHQTNGRATAARLQKKEES
jgi:hypothetical protein